MSNPNWTQDTESKLRVLDPLEYGITKSEYEETRGQSIHYIRWHGEPERNTIMLSEVA